MLPDTSDPSTYGLPKANLSEVVDPNTEFDYGEVEAWAIDCAAMTQTACRAWVVVDGDGTLLYHAAVWGNTVAVAPTVTRVGAGEYTIAWATSYYDLNPTVDRRVLHVVNIRNAKAQRLAKDGTGAILELSAEIDDAHTVSVDNYVGGVHTDVKFGLWVY